MRGLDQITSSWMLEASSENNSKMFYHPPWLERILGGKSLFIIGRKGTGKTAIAEHMKLVDKGNYTLELKFRDYPIENLKNFTDISAPSEFQYTPLWELLIYTSLCRLLAKTTNDKNLIKQLNNICPDDTDSIYDQLQSVVKKSYSLSIPKGYGNLGGSKSSEHSQIPSDWRKVKSFLQKTFIKNAPKGRPFYVLFDSLDEGYRNITTEKERAKTYFSMLACLFRASRTIKEECEKESVVACPIVFIRNDIYSQISDNDKNKWRDVEERLNWRRDHLEDMLTHRIVNTLELDSDMEFRDAWYSLIENKKIEIFKEKENKFEHITPFDYIATRTYMRPRDFVAYIKQCAKIDGEKDKRVDRGNLTGKISSYTIKKSDREYSKILLTEIEDELGQVIPKKTTVLRIISDIGRPVFHRADYLDIFNRKVSEGELADSDCPLSGNQVLSKFYEFSVIGNSKGKNKPREFKYIEEDSELSQNGYLCVHSGLVEALLSISSGKRDKVKRRINFDDVPMVCASLQAYLEDKEYSQDILDEFSIQFKTLALQLGAKKRNTGVIGATLGTVLSMVNNLDLNEDLLILRRNLMTAMGHHP